MFNEGAAFNGAQRHLRALAGWGGLLALGGVITLPGVMTGAGSRSVLPGVFGTVGAALALGGAVLLSAAMIAWSRVRVLNTAPEPYFDTLRQAAWPAGWPQTTLALGLGALGLANAALAVQATGAASLPTEQGNLVAGGVLMLVAFPLLVLERHYAALNSAELPEGPEIAWVLRLPIGACLAVAVSCLLEGAGYGFPRWLVRGGALFMGLAAIEIVLRVAAGLFLPPAPAGAPRHAVRSSLARLIRVTPPAAGSFGGEVERQFGIDLSRSWALVFLRRALLPSVTGLAVGAWLLTGVTALRLDERAVYERLGIPVSVLWPGLHWHLPWPFGTIRKIELGVIHELPLVLAEDSTLHPPAVQAEDLPPASADRLWNQVHPSEAAYLIASKFQERQGFQVVDIDLRLMYQIGRSDQAARDAVYRVADAPHLIRAVAGRILVGYFAVHTLDGVLGVDRDTFSSGLRSALQRDLDGLNSGLELVEVVVEGIHPPAAAAAAYQDVQAAVLRARELVSVQEAAAASSLGTARTSVVDKIARAQAAAAEALAEARAQQMLFAADRAVNHSHPSSFALERRLQKLGTGLAHTQLLVLDHRLEGDAAPTLDMRAPVGAASPP